MNCKSKCVIRTFIFNCRIAVVIGDPTSTVPIGVGTAGRCGFLAIKATLKIMKINQTNLLIVKNNHEQIKKKIPKSPSVMESMMAHEYKESENKMNYFPYRVGTRYGLSDHVP